MIRKQLQLDCFQWWFEFPIDNAAKTIIYGSIHNPIIEFEWLHKTRIPLFIKWIRVFILPRDQLLTHFFLDTLFRLFLFTILATSGSFFQVSYHATHCTAAGSIASAPALSPHGTFRAVKGRELITLSWIYRDSAAGFCIPTSKVRKMLFIFFFIGWQVDNHRRERWKCTVFLVQLYQMQNGCWKYKMQTQCVVRSWKRGKSKTGTREKETREYRDANDIREG